MVTLTQIECVCTTQYTQRAKCVPSIGWLTHTYIRTSILSIWYDDFVVANGIELSSSSSPFPSSYHRPVVVASLLLGRVTDDRKRLMFNWAWYKRPAASNSRINLMQLHLLLSALKHCDLSSKCYTKLNSFGKCSWGKGPTWSRVRDLESNCSSIKTLLVFFTLSILVNTIRNCENAIRSLSNKNLFFHKKLPRKCWSPKRIAWLTVRGFASLGVYIIQHFIIFTYNFFFCWYYHCRGMYISKTNHN